MYLQLSMWCKIIFCTSKLWSMYAKLLFMWLKLSMGCKKKNIVWEKRKEKSGHRWGKKGVGPPPAASSYAGVKIIEYTIKNIFVKMQVYSIFFHLILSLKFRLNSVSIYFHKLVIYIRLYIKTTFILNK